MNKNHQSCPALNDCALLLSRPLYALSLTLNCCHPSTFRARSCLTCPLSINIPITRQLFATDVPNAPTDDEILNITLTKCAVSIRSFTVQQTRDHVMSLYMFDAHSGPSICEKLQYTLITFLYRPRKLVKTSQ
jgi:hypothetical protein